ncbi:MAG TPA: formate dehydrogenase subunit gamma [Xanthomonadales bacterium]|nr:formate dehydrogenase subunit gamma [Xanthomonadales bacterium]
MQAALNLEETIGKIVSDHAGQIGALMPVLHAVQEHFGYVPEAAVPLLASQLNLSRAEVHGVIGFYHDFRSQPAGRHLIQVCRAEACQAMGSVALEQHIKQLLGIDFGQTTSDGQFSLEPVYCLGNCACTPSLRIDDDIHARVTPKRFEQLLQSLLEPGP